MSQEVSDKLTAQDARKVRNCEYYLRTKQVMQNYEAYKNFEVGEVYFIKRIDKRGKEVYVGVHYGSDTPIKYMIFHKDGGFVFAKRIIASGKLGKEVTCLTTQYDVGEYVLEPDPDYVNSLILQDSEGYDPLAAAKELAGKKNRARRKNKKMGLKFNTDHKAYNFLSSLKVGDKLYDATTAYGSGIIEWRVDQIDTISVTEYAKRKSLYRNTTVDAHKKAKFADVVEVKLKMVGNPPRSRLWVGNERSVYFTDFLSQRYDTYYSAKPFTVDDV